MKKIYLKIKIYHGGASGYEEIIVPEDYFRFFAEYLTSVGIDKVEIEELENENRLTKQISETIYANNINRDVYTNNDDLEDVCVNKTNEVYTKLGKLEDIEDELGIDSITFYKALINGVWVKDKVGQIYHTNVYLYNLMLSYNPVKKSVCFITPTSEMLLFDKIGQDWALTKEELISE